MPKVLSALPNEVLMGLRASPKSGRSRPGARRAALHVAAGAALLALAGCGGFEDVATSRTDPGKENPLTQRPYGPNEKEVGTLTGGSLFNTNKGDQNGGANLAVNKHLWRATLDTITSLNFLTLSSTDPYGGVIITDWGVPPETPAERLKVTAYITSAELKPQSLKVQVNRQTRGDAGEWVAAPVASETPRALEDAILTRARQLRIAAGDEEDS